MPQVQLPLFPVGTTEINSDLAFERKGDQIVYFNGHLPVFTHGVEDLAAFRIFTTQLIVTSTASYGQIAKALGVPKANLERVYAPLPGFGFERVHQTGRTAGGTSFDPGTVGGGAGLVGRRYGPHEGKSTNRHARDHAAQGDSSRTLAGSKKKRSLHLPPPRLPPRVNAAPAMR